MKKTLLMFIVFSLAFCLNSGAKGNKVSTMETKKTGLSIPSFGQYDPFSDDSNQITSTDMAKKKKKKKKKGRGGSSGMSFAQGNVIICAGYGTPNLTKSVYKAYQSYSNYKVTGSGPFHVKFEYAVSDNFGIGLSMNSVNTKVSWQDASYSTITNNDTTYNSGFKFNAIAFNVRANYHFVTEGALDVYGGMGIGYNNSKSTYFTNDPYGLDLSVKALIPLGLEFGIGMRYYFTDNIGLYLEVGPAKSLVQGGLAIKF